MNLLPSIEIKELVFLYRMTRETVNRCCDYMACPLHNCDASGLYIGRLVLIAQMMLDSTFDYDCTAAVNCTVRVISAID